MLYVLLTILILFVAILLLRLRLRLEYGSDQRVLSVSLGRTGPYADFATKTVEIRLFGKRIKRFSLHKDADPAEAEKPTKRKTKKSKPARQRSWRDMLAILPQVGGALWRFAVGLLNAATIEQLEAEIEAGFPEPHQTGQLYGYYQAALAAVPTSMARVRYIPDWTGASFTGSARLAVALPVYKLLFRTLLLLIELPLRKLIKLAIGKKKGASDG